MAKKPKQETQTIGGIDFTFQHPGIRTLIRISDKCKNKHGVLQAEPYYTEIMNHVIVDPKTSWDYFEEHEEIMEDVMEAAITFLNGRAGNTEE